MQPISLCEPAPGDRAKGGCPPAVLRILSGKDPVKVQSGTRAQRALAASANAYVAARPGERILLAQISRELGVTGPYLTEVFSQVEGASFYQYVLRKRLERAVTLLPHYAADLSHLALELGFSSHSHFSAAFTRAFGCAPAFFRSRARAVCKARGTSSQ
jgi:AraC family transcriptional regulator